MLWGSWGIVVLQEGVDVWQPATVDVEGLRYSTLHNREENILWDIRSCSMRRLQPCDSTRRSSGNPMRVLSGSCRTCEIVMIPQCKLRCPCPWLSSHGAATADGGAALTALCTPGLTAGWCQRALLWVIMHEAWVITRWWIIGHLRSLLTFPSHPSFHHALVHFQQAAQQKNSSLAEDRQSN